MPFCTDPGSFPRREESGQVTVLTQTCGPERRVKLRRESAGGAGLASCGHVTTEAAPLQVARFAVTSAYGAGRWLAGCLHVGGALLGGRCLALSSSSPRWRCSGGELSGSGPAGRFGVRAAGYPRVEGPANDRKGSPVAGCWDSILRTGVTVPARGAGGMGWWPGGRTPWAEGPAMWTGLLRGREGHQPGRAGSPPVLEVTCFGSHIQAEMGNAGALLCDLRLIWQLLRPSEGSGPALPAFFEDCKKAACFLEHHQEKSLNLASLLYCPVNSKVVPLKTWPHWRSYQSGKWLGSKLCGLAEFVAPSVVLLKCLLITAVWPLIFNLDFWAMHYVI